MGSLRVARSAAADLDEIWIYIAQRGGAAVAERFLESLNQRFALIARYPGLGRARPELQPGLRSLSVGRYRIYYRKDRSGVV